MAPRLNIPPVTRILLAVLLIQFPLMAAVRYREWSARQTIDIPYIEFVPRLSLLYPWTLATTTLAEGNFFKLVIAGLMIYHGGRYLERAWSGAEFAKFLAVVSVIPNMLCGGVLIFMAVLTRAEGWTLMRVSGTTSLQISFLVAFSQLVPAHTVTMFRGIVSLRVPRFPLLYIGMWVLLFLADRSLAPTLLLAVFGFMTSWTYLRFYKAVFPDLDSSQSSSLRGDASETFALAEFFPASVKPFVATLSAHVFDILVSVRVCSPFSSDDMSATRNDGFLQRGVPGSARAEAERRRALALKALDQRLHAATAQASSPKPQAQTGQSSAGQSSNTNVQTQVLGQGQGQGQPAVPTAAATATTATTAAVAQPMPTNVEPDQALG